MTLTGAFTTARFVATYPDAPLGGAERITFEHGTMAGFERDVSALSDTSGSHGGQRPSATTAISSARAVPSDLATLRQNTSALNRDVTALQGTLSNERADLAQTQQDAGAKASSSSTRCGAVATVRTDAANVASDAQFTAGFLNGLDGTATSLRALASKLETEYGTAQRGRSELPTSVGTALPQATAVTQAERDATHATTAAADSAIQVVGTANDTVASAFAAANRLITSTGCGAILKAPDPIAA